MAIRAPPTAATVITKMTNTMKKYLNWPEEDKENNGPILEPILQFAHGVYHNRVSLYQRGTTHYKELLYVVLLESNNVNNSNSMVLYMTDTLRQKSPEKLLWGHVYPTELIMKYAVDHLTMTSHSASSKRWPNLIQRMPFSFPFLQLYGDAREKRTACNFGNFAGHSVPMFTLCTITDCQHAFPS